MGVHTKLSLALVCLLASMGIPADGQQKGAPNVHINVLNVCTPSAAEQTQIAGALQRVPVKPGFSTDFEVDRGRSLLPDGPLASWVRIRREFAGEGPYTGVQYSFSSDSGQIDETLVFQTRNSKKDDLLQLMIHVTLPAGNAAQALAANAPAGRIRLERFGASSVVLARCPGADQSGYETLFRTASEILASYRTALDVRDTVPADLARLPHGR